MPNSSPRTKLFFLKRHFLCKKMYTIHKNLTDTSYPVTHLAPLFPILKSVFTRYLPYVPSKNPVNSRKLSTEQPRKLLYPRKKPRRTHEKRNRVKSEPSVMSFHKCSDPHEAYFNTIFEKELYQVQEVFICIYFLFHNKFIIRRFRSTVFNVDGIVLLRHHSTGPCQAQK